MSESEITGATEAPNTDATEVAEDNVQEKTFSQADLEKIIADRVSRERRKFEKKFEGVDIELYNELTTKAEQEKEERMKAKGEFEKLLKETVQKKDQQIESLMGNIRNIKVDGNLVDTAARMKAVNPQQVATLLKGQVRLNETGDVEVFDPKTGQVRYNDAGESLTIDNLMSEFLQANTHFVSAGPSGSGSESKVGNSTGSGEKFDIGALDMKNPEHRKIYAEYRKKAGIA